MLRNMNTATAYPASAGSPVHPDAPCVVRLDRHEAAVSLGGAVYTLPLDIDSADDTVRPAWWRAGSLTVAALADHEDALIEILTDAYTAQRRDEVCS